MRSILADRFDTLDGLETALVAAMRSYPYRIETKGKDWIIRLPNRPEFTLRRPKWRLSFKRRRTIEGYEPVVTAMFDFVMDHAEVPAIYDIGAGGGYFAFIGGARADRTPEVHCFEMVLGYLDQLIAVKARYGLDRVTPHLAGMSDAHKGEHRIWYSLTKMYEREPDPKAVRIPWWRKLKNRMRGAPNRDAVKSATVTIDSIDAFTERNGLKPGLIKIDVDGYEAKVLPGGMETFREHRPVILLELHKSRFFAHHGVTRPEIVKPLLDLGYTGLFFSNHHSLSNNRVIRVTPDSPELSRESTDFLMLV